jgi:hypothetical protein
MEIVQNPQPKKDVNLRTAQMVQLLTEIGPDIPEIARRLGQFKESVRYRYKEKIVNRGIAVQAIANHQKLGLKRVIVELEFAEEFAQYANTILASMNDLCYVVSFAKTLPDSKYIVHASVPFEHVKSFVDFFGVLKDKGMFTNVYVGLYDTTRVSPMRAEYYDFDSGRWDYDWSAKPAGNFGPSIYTSEFKSKFDEVDLYIIKELQIDANFSLKQISDKLGINYKKLAWHFSSHVLANGLLSGYKVNWMGSAVDVKNDKGLHKKHRYVTVELFVKNVTNMEKVSLAQVANSLPFLWSEASGDNYFAEFAFPVEHITEALEYLEEMTSQVKAKSGFFILDPSNALTFTIPYKLFNGEKKQWEFDLTNLIARYESLIIKIREGVS